MDLLIPFPSSGRMTSLQMSAQEEMVEKFLDAAARGDLSQLSALLSHSPSLLNQTGYSGWTALMLATRNGHHHVAEKLLSLGYTPLPLKTLCLYLSRDDGLV